MYLEHPAFKSPQNKFAKLWRYFDLAKFLSFIVRGELFFASLALLREVDVLEGFWSRYDFNLLYSGDDDWESAKKISDQFAQITFVNCWHMNEYESAAMWRLYGEQLAVQTTFERLTQAFVDDKVYVGLVRYIDYATERIHLPDEPSEYRLAMTKDRSFEHEKEVRVLLPEYPGKSLIEANEVDSGRLFADYPYSGKGVSVRVDVVGLIEAIYVSPKLPAWHTELLRSLLGQYGLAHIPIKPSRVGQLP